MTTRLEKNFLSKLNQPDIHFYTAVGHGDTFSGEPKIVPGNVYVIFMTPAGYHAAATEIMCPSFRKFFIINKRNTIAFLQGKTTNIPALSKFKNWDWKRHIYPPFSKIPNFKITFKHHRTNNNHQKINERLGLYRIGNVGAPRYGYGQEMDIDQLMRGVSTSVPPGHGAVLFVMACRGSENINKLLNAQANEIVNAPKIVRRRWKRAPGTEFRLQRRQLPYTSYTPIARSNATNFAKMMNNLSSRYLTRKRVSSKLNEPVKKRFNKKTFENFVNNSYSLSNNQLKEKYPTNYTKFMNMRRQMNILTNQLNKMKIV